MILPEDVQNISSVSIRTVLMEHELNIEITLPNFAEFNQDLYVF